MAPLIQKLALPIALHLALCLGVYQFGFSNEEMQVLQIEGPSRMIEPYVEAARRYGPLGVLRAYLRGESDERLYLEYARLLLRGEADMAYIADRQNDPSIDVALPARAWPYRDVRVEYPPLAFLALLPPALISLEYAGYRWAFVAYMTLLHLLNLALAFQLLAPPMAAGYDAQQRLRLAARALWASLAFCCALGTVLVTRMDHLATTWTLLSLVAFARAQRSCGSARLAWAAACGGVAAIGVMTKLVPGLALLAAAALWLRAAAPDRARCLLAAGAAGALTLLAINLALFAAAGEPYLDTFRYHGLRGIQLESLYSGVLLLLRPLGLSMHIDESFGSTNLASAATPLLKTLSPLLFLLGAGYVCLRRRFSQDGLGATVLSCILLLSFILTHRVFSPQYLIWVGAPLCVLAALQPERRRLWLLFLGAVLLSQLIFPRGYPILKAFHPLAVLVLNLRNLALVVFCVGLVRAYSRAPGAPEV
jgi:4-amino-4-deoxy-L-arabinose transferase-like glycosyltransferase